MSSLNIHTLVLDLIAPPADIIAKLELLSKNFGPFKVTVCVENYTEKTDTCVCEIQTNSTHRTIFAPAPAPAPAPLAQPKANPVKSEVVQQAQVAPTKPAPRGAGGVQMSVKHHPHGDWNDVKDDTPDTPNEDDCIVDEAHRGADICKTIPNFAKFQKTMEAGFEKSPNGCTTISEYVEKHQKCCMFLLNCLSYAARKGYNLPKVCNFAGCAHIHWISGDKPEGWFVSRKHPGFWTPNFGGRFFVQLKQGVPNRCYDSVTSKIFSYPTFVSLCKHNEEFGIKVSLATPANSNIKIYQFGERPAVAPVVKPASAEQVMAVVDEL